MNKALPGQHYCENHQGNTSHYDPANCLVCEMLKALKTVDRRLPHNDTLKAVTPLSTTTLRKVQLEISVAEIFALRATIAKAEQTTN